MTERELCALVAEKVFGWTAIQKYSLGIVGKRPGGDGWEDIPDYLTWTGLGLVVEKMETEKKGALYLMLFDYGTYWQAEFVNKDYSLHNAWADAPTAPMAVAVAAFRAVGVEIKDDEVPK